MGAAGGKLVDKSDFAGRDLEQLTMVNNELPGFKFVNVPASDRVVNGAYVSIYVSSIYHSSSCSTCSKVPFQINLKVLITLKISV